MDPDVRHAWLRIALAQGLGPRTWQPVLAHVSGDPIPLATGAERFWRQYVSRARAQRIHRALRDAMPARVEAEAHALGQRVLVPSEDAWPTRRLEGLSDPPAALFLEGAMPPDEQPTVAIVGTRDVSPYGERHAHDLAVGAARAGLCVISGFAMGVDRAAHEGSLRPFINTPTVGGENLGTAGESPGCATLAVLATGVDVPYPAAHQVLRRAVVQYGGLLSEYPPGHAAAKWQFPARNRLVAALADAVVVVEAPAKSGALITARLANELGRDCLAVPGPLGRRHRGSHRLLRDGAGLCESVSDILFALGLPAPARPGRSTTRPASGTGARAGAKATPRPETPALARVQARPGGIAGALLAHLEDLGAQTTEALCDVSGEAPHLVATALATLELDGLVLRRPGRGWVLA